MVPVLTSHIEPSASFSNHGNGSGRRFDVGAGSGLVNFRMTPRLSRAGSASQMTASFNSGLVKQGSWIALPAMQRHASGLSTATESVQQCPQRSGPSGAAGWKVITRVARIAEFTGGALPADAVAANSANDPSVASAGYRIRLELSVTALAGREARGASECLARLNGRDSKEVLIMERRVERES